MACDKHAVGALCMFAGCSDLLTTGKWQTLCSCRDNIPRG